VDTNKTITHLSLCSGYEGIGLGLRSVLPTLREVAYVEREGFPIANLVAKMEEGKLDTAPVFTDVKTFPYGKFRGCVDILSGGFPCQPFSAAGKRQATEDPRHLFPYIAEGIRECQPRIVFLENVQGILSCKTADGEPVLRYVLRTLEGLGYRATAGIFSAEEVGAPHQRKRVFIMGYSDSQRCEGERLRGDERESEGSLSGGSGEELANSNNDGHRENSRGNGKAEGLPGEHRSEVCGGLPNRTGQELANSISEGLEGHSGHEYGEGRQSTGQSGSTTTSGLPSRWPARPSEPQHEWEEPRVVADTKSKQGSSRDNGEESRASSQSEESQSGGGHSGSLRESNGQAEPKLGRASNGSSSRVDKLRLLGNGVVPATAAKAFVTLIQRLI